MRRVLTLFVLTYNRPDFLARCLESIRQQTFTNFQVIVLDNASTLDCRSVCQAARLPNLRHLRHDKNLGSIGNFRSAWLFDVETDLLTIFHDDDLMHPTMLEQQVEIMVENPNLSWVGTGMRAFSGPEPRFPSLPLGPTRLCDSHELANGLMADLDPCFSSVMYRSSARSLVDLESLLSRCSIVFDRPLLLELARRNPCVVIQSPLVYYRQHPAQDSRTGPLRIHHILELYASYRAILAPDWSPRTQSHFYRWSSVGLWQSFRRLSPLRPLTLFEFLSRGREMDVFRPAYLRYYPGHVLGQQLGRMQRLTRRLLEKMNVSGIGGMTAK